jgi:hypothetical protein
MRSNWDWKTHRRCGGQSSHSPKHDELCEGKVRVEEIEDGSGSGETLETERIEGYIVIANVLYMEKKVGIEQLCG